MLLLMKEQNQMSARVNLKQKQKKVQNDNVKLESFTDVDIDERTEPEVTESKFKTEVEEKVQNNTQVYKMA